MSCSALSESLTGILPTLIDIADIALSIVGLLPVGTLAGVETACDAVTIILNILNNDPLGTVLSIISVIPLAGEVTGSFKIAYKIYKILSQFISTEIIYVLVLVIAIGCMGLAYYIYSFF